MTTGLEQTFDGHRRVPKEREVLQKKGFITVSVEGFPFTNVREMWYTPQGMTRENVAHVTLVFTEAARTLIIATHGMTYILHQARTAPHWHKAFRVTTHLIEPLGCIEYHNDQLPMDQEVIAHDINYFFATSGFGERVLDL